MRKGHNKGPTKLQGQDRHLKDDKKDKSHNADEDPSGGSKGKNSI
jgi:hypothetical protein